MRLSCILKMFGAAFIMMIAGLALMFATLFSSMYLAMFIVSMTFEVWDANDVMLVTIPVLITIMSLMFAITQCYINDKNRERKDTL